MRASDYIFRRLKEVYGVERVFMITGGGAMHLNDAVYQSGIAYTCCHHEQACAIAAEGYVRAGKPLGVVNITTGPGGLNTLTGVMGQWTDSVPVLYISGQVKQSTTIAACPELPLRQLGDQEVDIISVVKPLVKYAAQIRKVEDVRRILDEAVHTALSGRPGPVWIDVPMDIQGALVDEAALDREKPEVDEPQRKQPDSAQMQKLFDLLDSCERPVLIAGNGIRISGAQEKMYAFLQKMPIPALGTFNGMDMLYEEHPCFVGRIGTLGSRSGNFALQNADLVLSVGSRNNIRQTSYNYEYFARGGKLVCIDVDKAEMQKPTVQSYLAIEADASAFFDALLNYTPRKKYDEWLLWALERKIKYPVVLPEFEKPGMVNPYYFVDALSRTLPKNAVVATANGSACVIGFQAVKVKQGQRWFWNSGCAAMGYDLPAAIGAALATPGSMHVCLGGEGSLMMNIQELSTAIANKINLKLVILNNGGYISIRQTQNNFFEGRHIGIDSDSGVVFPDFMKLAESFGFVPMRIERNEDVNKKIQEMCAIDKPMVCEVMLPHNYIFQPKTSSVRKSDGKMVSKPLEDLYPFLPREEFLQNMIINPINE
ncbi:MAG: thiamine pyrophosphate-binding protein [Lentimicrobiaceae bacterium]|nr:thiamine pyrophosphate-binding protein [Lentimicrobiaceae bacterium]